MNWSRIIAAKNLPLRLLFLVAAIGHSQAAQIDTNDLILNFRARQFSTTAYRDAAVSALLQDANLIAGELGLPERLPIRTADLVEAYAQPPALADEKGWFGTVGTSNFHYSASAGNKMCHLEWNRSARSSYLETVRLRYSAAKAHMETNGAYALARKWLVAMHADVNALERDCNPEVHATEEGENYVPVFWVLWRQPAASGHHDGAYPDENMQTVASVWLVEPEKRLLQLDVKQRYLLRRPLEVPERERLLQQTEDPTMRKMWFTTADYKSAALEIALAEANRAARLLALAEHLPIQRDDLKQVIIATPFVSDNFGHFATLRTEDYVYSMAFGNKLTWIEKNLDFEGERSYLAALRKKYATSKSVVNTNGAYALAARWLTALDVDVTRLERSCSVRIQPSTIGGKMVPLYDVVWQRTTKDIEQVEVNMEILEPECLLKSLMIRDATYIKRTVLSVPNREKLLAPSVK